MVDIFTKAVQPIVKIRRDEWRKVIIMFLYFAFTVATLYILKPVRNSIFLAAKGAGNLRYAYIGEGILILFATLYYTSLSKKFKQKNHLFTIATFFFISNLLIFWLLFRTGHVKALAYILYVWHGTYSITIVTQFWTLANDLFDPQEAKRLFGVIISGGGVGQVIGSMIVNRTAVQIGTENLLLIPVGLLLICVVLINLAWKIERHPQHVEKKEEEKPKAKLSDKSAWRLLLKSRYLFYIAGIVMLAKISSTLIDNQWNAVIEETIAGKDQRTAFYGAFFFWAGVVTFVVQLVVSSKIIRYFGVGISLLLLPIGVCFGAVGTAIFPLLAIACATKIYDGSFNYSIQKMSQEILYLPIPSKTRYKAKPIIDMLLFRQSKGLAGLLIIAVTAVFAIPDQKLGYVLAGLVPVWIIVVWAARGEYIRSIKHLLMDKPTTKDSSGKPTLLATEAFYNLEGEHSFAELKKNLGTGSSVTRKMSATACLAFYSGVRDINRVKKLIQEMMRYEALELKGVELDELVDLKGNHESGTIDAYLQKVVKSKFTSQGGLVQQLKEQEGEILPTLLEHLNDKEGKITDKKKIIMILSMMSTQGAVDILLNGLATTDDHSLRFNLIRSLNRIKSQDKDFQFNSWILKKETLSEIKNNKDLCTVLEEYSGRDRPVRTEEDYLFATLRALQAESIERIFRLLGLLYASDVIHVIHDRLVELEPDRHMRANALELLDNVVEPELGWKLRGIFDDIKDERPQEREIKGALKRFFNSGDCWLQICAIFYAAELKMRHFDETIEIKTHSDDPIVKQAAEIATLKLGAKETT